MIGVIAAHLRVVNLSYRTALKALEKSPDDRNSGGVKLQSPRRKLVCTTYVPVSIYPSIPVNGVTSTPGEWS